MDQEETKQKTLATYIKEGIIYVCNPMNTIREFKSLPVLTKAIFIFLLLGLAVYFVLLGDYSAWGWLSIIGLIFSSINLALVDNGKLTSYIWGILCGICSLIGAAHYSMYGDLVYYCWTFPWMVYGLGVWHRLSDNHADNDTQKLSCPRKDIWKYSVLFIASYVIMYFLSVAAGGAIPLLDSFILSCGVVGQLFLSKSYKQQWIMWLAQDVIAVIAWSVRLNIAFTSGEMTTYALSMVIMWGIFLINAIYGTYMWYRKAPNEK